MASTQLMSTPSSEWLEGGWRGSEGRLVGRQGRHLDRINEQYENAAHPHAMKWNQWAASKHTDFPDDDELTVSECNKNLRSIQL
jgi:hypothetical protein